MSRTSTPSQNMAHGARVPARRALDRTPGRHVVLRCRVIARLLNRLLWRRRTANESGVEAIATPRSGCNNIRCDVDREVFELEVRKLSTHHMGDIGRDR